jgi:exonuclease SbcD
MTTNILHISDTHLGNMQYRSAERQQDYADAFDEAVRLATDDTTDHEIDAVLHTGDLFHAPNPNVPTVNRCLDTLDRLSKAGIPFYGIVGNHERKRDEQWLDLVRRFDVVERLDRSPVYVGEGDDRVALYGIDAVRRPEWPSADLELEPPEGDEYVLLAMHELLSPVVPDIMANYEASDVLGRTGIHVDGLALGDYHEPEQADVDGTHFWYPGSTEKIARDESTDHYVNKLVSDDGELMIHKLRLDSPRDFVDFEIEFAESDGFSHAERTVKKYDLTGSNGKSAVAIAVLNGEKSGVTAQDVHGLLTKHGAAVTKVIDNRGIVAAEDIEAEAVDMSEMNALIDDEVEGLELSSVSQTLEGLVRSDDVKKTSLRSEAGDILDTELDIDENGDEDFDIVDVGTGTDTDGEAELTTEGDTV